jgi:hypothetical protein
MSVWRCSLRTVNMNFCWVEDVVLVGGARNSEDIVEAVYHGLA